MCQSNPLHTLYSIHESVPQSAIVGTGDSDLVLPGPIGCSVLGLRRGCDHVVPAPSGVIGTFKDWSDHQQIAF